MTNTLIRHLPSRGGLGGVLNMYIKPALCVESAQAAQMLAVSLGINGDTKVSGDDALTKEEEWELWSDDEE